LRAGRFTNYQLIGINNCPMFPGANTRQSTRAITNLYQESAMQPIAMEQIRIDGGTQSRRQIDEDVILEYAANVGELPPVSLIFDGAAYWLWDGFHRYHAHQRAGSTTIPAEVENGTQRDAILKSFGANHNHGLRRTHEDKRIAVQMLLADAEWSAWSLSKIADVCRVSRNLVSDIRSSLAQKTSEDCDSASKTGFLPKPQTPPPVGESPQMQAVREKAAQITQAGGTPRFTQTKHGTVTVMDVSRIGRANPIAQPAATSPDVKQEAEALPPATRQAPPWNRQNRRVKQAIPILLGLRKFLGEAFDDDPVNSRLKGEYAGHVNRDSTLNAISQVTRELEDAVIVSAADNPPGYVWAGKLREERFKVA
jgi:uncharacterized ParB-like nuclease family protein